jgi:hypothetical protein
MFKKITGQDLGDCRNRMVAAKADMVNFLKILNQKK